MVTPSNFFRPSQQELNVRREYRNRDNGRKVPTKPHGSRNLPSTLHLNRLHYHLLRQLCHAAVAEASWNQNLQAWAPGFLVFVLHDAQCCLTTKAEPRPHSCQPRMRNKNVIGGGSGELLAPAPSDGVQ